MEWLIFFLGIAVLETLFQVLVSTRLAKTLTTIKKVVKYSEYPKKITPKRTQRLQRLYSESQKINPNLDSVPSQ